MIDPNQLISKYPLAAEACFIDADMGRFQFVENVRDFACVNKIGNCLFDSIESLMSDIESHLASRPKPMTDEDVAKMRWSAPIGGDQQTVFGDNGLREVFEAWSNGDQAKAIAAHNKTVDRLWSSVLAERAEVARLKKELEARR